MRLSTPSSPATTAKHVALMVEALHGEGPRFLQGFRKWVQTNPGWELSVFEGEGDELLAVVQRWEGDGMICAASHRKFREAAYSRNLPTVNISEHPLNHAGVSVVSDSAACGRLAAEYFLDRGFRQLSYVMGSAADIEAQPFRAYAARAREEDAEVSYFVAGLGQEKELATWLKSQSRPTALYTATDPQAAAAIEACHLAGLQVPEEVAVLGTGNRQELCELCTPSLSSIECDSEARGYEAASQLARLMNGEHAHSRQVVRIPPAGVVTRRSTETYAFDDEELCSALRFIHENAGESIKVKDVLTSTNISRRSLENRFRRYFRRTLHEEIWRVHFERAKQLLVGTDLSLQQIAERSGFRTASALANLFKQKTGLTPRTYRANHRR